MRVNANRLDLGSLREGERCTITTGTAWIKLMHGRNVIDMGIYLNGVDMRPLFDPGLMIREGGVHWLHLTKLAPRRLYTVLSSDGGSGVRPDATYEVMVVLKLAVPQSKGSGAARRALDKALGKLPYGCEVITFES